MKFTYAKNPKWANRAKTVIFLMVKFEKFENELFFAANPMDSEAHGRDLFQRSLNGEFGKIEEFSAVKPTLEEVVTEVRNERDKMLVSTDWTQANDIPQATKDKWAIYRQALRDVPQQQEFPWYNQVVVEADHGYEIDATKAQWPAKP